MTYEEIILSSIFAVIVLGYVIVSTLEHRKEIKHQKEKIRRLKEVLANEQEKIIARQLTRKPQ